MKMIKRVFNSVIKAIDEKEMTITAAVSTSGIDRMNESVDAKGADLRNFKKNPVVLWAHNYDLPPIGKALWIKRDGESIVSKMKFAGTEFAKEVFDLYKDGFLSAFSIGFIPKNFIDGKTDKDPRTTFTEWEMLEYSAVPVPANPEALALAMQKGILKNEDIKNAMEDSGVEDSGNDDETVENNPDESDGESAKEEKPEEQHPKETGLDELMAENEQLKENVKHLEKTNATLRYEVYKLLNEKNESFSEIADSFFQKRISEIADGAIRKAMGKVN